MIEITSFAKRVAILVLSIAVLAVCIVVQNNNINKKKSQTVEVLIAPMLFEDQKDWTDLESKISASNAATIFVKWEGSGGSVLIGLQFLDYMRSIKGVKNVVFEVIGPSYSLHAFSLCNGFPVVFSAEGSLAFHAVKFDNTYATETAILRVQNEQLDKCVALGLLNKENKEQVTVAHKMVVSYPDGKGGMVNEIEDDM